MTQYVKIMKTVKNSDVMKRQCDNYRKNFDYAAGIEFEETCDALAYDDKLVRDFVEKIEVFPDRMRFTMKAGMVTEVAM